MRANENAAQQGSSQASHLAGGTAVQSGSNIYMHTLLTTPSLPTSNTQAGDLVQSQLGVIMSGNMTFAYVYDYEALALEQSQYVDRLQVAGAFIDTYDYEVQRHLDQLIERLDAVVYDDWYSDYSYEYRYMDEAARMASASLLNEVTVNDSTISSSSSSGSSFGASGRS